MAGALEGIRVVDLTAMFNGPIATMILGDQGADVVKVEPPGVGDIIRQFGLQRAGIGPIFQSVNRNKRSVVLDLRQARGRDLLMELSDRADVLIQNFRPGVMERLGLGAEVLRERNEQLIYTSIHAYGETGPYAKRPAFDSLIQAVSGMAASQGDEEPALIRNSLCDKLTGLQVAQAITAALFARERGAGGQHLRVSMLDASVSFLWIDAMQLHTYLGEDPQARRRPFPRALPTRDGGHVLISCITDAQYRSTCRALDLEPLIDDERFANLTARSEHMHELLALLAERTRLHDTESVCARLEAEDAPHAAVTALGDVPHHPQIVANGTLVEMEHPHCGAVRIPRPVEDFDVTPSTIRCLAPLLGEHTDEVLAELGHDAATREKLRVDGVLG
jgi:crotonobetainyl-CoA:carnitine CoA-transferase CaiB-like acyl-CoA transferase